MLPAKARDPCFACFGNAVLGLQALGPLALGQMGGLPSGRLCPKSTSYKTGDQGLKAHRGPGKIRIKRIPL